MGFDPRQRPQGNRAQRDHQPGVDYRNGLAQPGRAFGDLGRRRRPVVAGRSLRIAQDRVGDEYRVTLQPAGRQEPFKITPGDVAVKGHPVEFSTASPRGLANQQDVGPRISVQPAQHPPAAGHARAAHAGGGAPEEVVG